MSDAEQKRKKLLELLAKAPAQTQRLQALSREIIRAARLGEDIAKPVRELVAAMPAEALSPEQWDQFIGAVQSWLAQGARLESSITVSVYPFIAGTSVMTSTSTSMIYSVVLSGSDVGRMQAGQKELNRVLEQASLVDSARSSMRRLGLDRRPREGRKSALELLDDAKTALYQPSGAAGGETGVLIPLREAIDTSLSELVRRCPGQERTPNTREKIRSIGRHCALPAVQDQFEALATTGDSIVNRLSGSKQAALSREDLMRQFQEGVAFLDALLQSVDATKLR